MRTLTYIWGLCMTLATALPVAVVAQSNNCSGAIQICNNQLAEQLDDGVGTQECPTGGCGCMLAGEKNTRWFKITIQTGGTLEFTIRPYNGSADYDFAVWNRGPAGTCPSGAAMGSPDRCNFAAPKLPTGIRGSGNGNSNTATGNLYSNSMTVAAGDVIYLLIDNYDGTTEGFYLDFFGGTPGSGTGTTATFSCSNVNQCTSCTDADCKTWRFNSPGDYSFDETAANGGCHSNFAYASVQTATVCGTFTVPAPYTTVEFPRDRGYEITATNGSSSTTCLNSAVITYQVWGTCGTPLTPNPANSGIYTGLNNSTTYKVCKTVSVSGANCYLSRICLPYWTFVNNDNMCSATPLTMNAAPVSGTNAGASTTFDAGCTSYREVWYSFVAPASGRAQVNVDPDAASDVKINLVGPMAGLDGGVNDCNLNCATFDEDNTVMACVDDRGTDGVEKLFTFLIPGQTYYVWVSGTWARPTANFTIQVTDVITADANYTPGPQIVGAPDPIPSNDQCANAIDLNPMCAYKPGTTVGATAECTDPDPEYVAAATLENDVWFKWTAPANNGNAQVTLEVTGVSCTAGEDGSLGIQFGIFRGSCGSLTPVSSGTTTLTFTPIPGATYYFVIDGNAGAQCTFNIGVKRPTITSQSCSGGSYCAGSSLAASFNYSYSGSNPGYRWAYCKSSTFGTPCTIDLNNPATYSIYNGGGLPNPGCTPATYTFVGYLLADNGATTIAPGYPRPQPVSANCVNQTSPCTFNIYPNIAGTVTVNRTNCTQTVTANAACSPAAPIVISGNTNQSYGAGNSGTFTPVTVNWNSTYNNPSAIPPIIPPANCSTYTITGNYACPGPSGSNTCPGATLIVGAPATASSNTGIAATTSEYVLYCGNGNNGSGVWFNFVAPNSGKATITLSNVGTSDNLDPMLYLFKSRRSNDIDCIGDGYEHPDICAACTDMNTSCKLNDQLLYCSDVNLTNVGETINAIGLNPGETYYIMVDGYFGGTYSNGNFSIRVTDPGPSITRPVNDNICGATDLTTICTPSYGNNFNATSLCSGDPAFPSGYSTENSVWYTYTPSVSGPVTINYTNAIGTHCAFPGLEPGIQFTTYTSSDGTCNGTLTNVPAGSVYTGVTSGTVTINMTAGVKYYILVDGYAGNECAYEFQIYNGTTCCNADLGQTEGPSDIMLCFGDQVTFGVTADPINFGLNAGSNPVIGWQYSATQPTVNNPFNPANGGKPYYVGQIDWTMPGTPTTRYYEDTEGNYPYSTLDANGNNTYYNVTMAGFPAGATFNPATDTITLCISAGMNYFADLDIDLVAPDGSVYRIVHDQCGADYGWMNVCFSNFGTSTNITTACPGGNEVTGYYLPMDAWAGLSGEGINGVWRLRVEDDVAGLNTYFTGFTLQIRKPVTSTGPPVVGPHHGDFTIINNDPFKFGSQVFWLTPVTFVDYSGGTLYPDSCYHYGTPVKVTMLERITTPTFTPTCAAPGDGSNGTTLTVTSPTGGWPGLVPVPSPAQYFTVTGTGSASGISFPSPPVGEGEVSNSFTVPNGGSWAVTFTDANGCTNRVGGTYDRPQVGPLLIDSAACDGLSVPFSVTQLPKPYARYRITLDFDSYPQDVYWFLEDGSGNVVASGGSYASTLGGVTVTTGNLDPNKGPYKFILYDAGNDGFGSGGGTNTSGSSVTNFIKLEELYADGTSTTLFNEIYAFCSPVYCTGPAASVFNNKTVVLGTPTGTFVNGATAAAYAGSACGGAPISGTVTLNTDGTGTFNTGVAGVNPGATYSIKYTYTDAYGCQVSACSPIDIFPTLTLNPLVNCGVNPPTISAGASCTGCNATYIAEYSFDGGNTWSTSTTSTYNDIYVYGRIRNVLTGRIGCEVSSFKLDNCPPVILPVELLWIQAKPVDNSYIQVSWSTASEKNSAYFDVERSLDGIHFSYVGRVPASGNSSSVHTYYYNDRDVSPNVRYYYRVKCVDADSTFKYTKIVSAILDGAKDLSIISVYPNPMHDFTVVSLNVRNEMPAALTVYNDLGQVMIQQEHLLQKGLNEWRIETSTLAAGTYYLKVLYSTNEETRRLIILE